MGELRYQVMKGVEGLGGFVVWDLTEREYVADDDGVALRLGTLAEADRVVERMNQADSHVPVAPPSSAPSVASENMTLWFAAVVAHLNKFPDLNGTIVNVLGYQADITVRHSGVSRLECLAEWVRSLADVTLVRVQCVYDDGSLLLHVNGDLVDGTRAEVSCITSLDEADLLAVNTPVAKGATFSLDLLFRLTSSADAEAVSR
jgi:hypothetical protein